MMQAQALHGRWTRFTKAPSTTNANSKACEAQVPNFRLELNDKNILLTDM